MNVLSKRNLLVTIISIFLINVTANARVTIIGHRGGISTLPENTRANFQQAVQRGVDIIELDVHLCKSGEIMIIHDALLDRTTNGAGYVSEMTYEQIKKFTTENGETIPTLQEAIEVVDKKARIMLDLKSQEVIEPTIEILKQYMQQGWKAEDFVFISFNHHYLKRAHELLPEVEFIASMFAIPLGNAQYADELKAQYVFNDPEIVTQEFIDHAHQLGKKVYLGVVRSEDKLASILAMNVEGVMLDDIEQMLSH